MSTESVPAKSEEKKVVKVQGGGSDSVYALGMVGAWVYFFKGVTNFKEGALAFGKGLVWPAILVYEAFKLLKK